MKKSLLLSTLIAAVALSVPAFALDGEGTSSSPYYGTIQGSEIFSTSDTTTIYVGTESAALGGDNTNSYFAGHSSETYYVSNIHINAGGIYITNGNGGDYHYYSGTITGTGDWTVTYVEGASDNSGNTDVTQRYSFTGDLSGWTGNFKIYTVNTDDYVYYGNGNVAATNTNISGNGGSISVDFGEVQYNYTGYAEGTSASALTVTNSSIEAHKVTFTGSVNYEVSSTITGWDGSGYNRGGTTETKAENSTLTISNTGTTTFTGAVSNFDTVTVASGSTLAVGSGGSLDLSGATVNLGSTIQNAGAITIDSDTSFVIDSSVSHTGWSDGSATYTLIASGGTITGYDESISVSVSNIYNVIVSSVSCENNTLTVTLTDNAEASGLHGTGESDNPYYTTGTTGTSIPTSIFTGAGTTVYLASETQSLGNSSDNIYWSDSVNAACDIVIGAAGIYLTNGSGNNVHTFSGKISGEGDWTVSHTSSAGSGVAQYYIFTGDLSQWSGSFTIDTTNTGDYVYFGNGGTAATNTAISGTGAVAVDYGTVRYNYSAGAGGETGETLTVTNSSIEAHQVIFTGGVNYEVSANLTGYDANGATGSTLEISTAGTVTASGKVSGFDIVTVKGNSTLAIAQGGSLDLSGATVNLGSTIQNSGTITIDTSTSFVLDDSMAYTGDWTSTDGATYTLISGSGTIYIGTTELTSNNVSSSLTLDNVSSSSVEISDATFSYVDGTLSVTVKGTTAPLGSTASNPYTGSVTDLDLSTWAAGSTVYISGITSGYFANSGTNAMSIVADINISYAENDTSKNGLSLNNAYSDVIYTFSGKITGDGNWTFDGGTGNTPTQHYIFTGDVSGYSGNFSLTAGTSARSEGYLEFGDGGQAATNTNVSGTGSITTSTNFAVIYNYGSLADGDENAITIGNTSITTADLQFAGSVDYIVSADTTITSASSSGSFTVSTQGTVTILGTLTTGSDSNAFSSLSVAEGSTLRIGATNTFYMDTTSTSGDVFVVSGTLEVAEGVSFTIRKRSAATGYSIANLSLENGSTLLLNTYGSNQPGSSGGLSIGTLTVTGSATLKTDSTGGNSHWQNSMNIAALVGKDATLNLTSDIASSVANIFELGTSGNTESTSQFTGKIVLSDSASGSRGLTLIVSEENIAAGAVIEMGAEDSTDALALGVNADRVEIAGLVSGGSGNNGGDIVYSGYVSMGATLGDAGATLIDYKGQASYGSGSNYDGVGVSRNTLVINVASSSESYSFSGVIMDMLNLEKTGAGTQSIEFKLSSAGSTGYYFDGSIAVTEGTLNLSGVETNSAGITVAKDATLNIANHITLAATSDITSVSSTISGTLNIAEGGQLDLAGTVTINNAISNSGSITIADGTSITVGVEVQTGEYSGTNYDYYTLIDGSNGSGSVTLGDSVTFVIDGTEITLSEIATLADGDTDWKGYISGGSLFIYAETSTTAETADPLYWAGTADNNTWSTQSSDTPWSATDGGSSGYYFAEGASVTFGPNTDGELSTTIVLGENITAGTVNITGSGYTLTAGAGNTLTATEIVLDDEESGDTHTFTIAQGVTVTAGTLTETAGQLDLVVNGELNVTNDSQTGTITVNTNAVTAESISGTGKLTADNLTFNSLIGSTLTISVSEAEFGNVTVANHGSDAKTAYKTLVIGDGTNETTVKVNDTLLLDGGMSAVEVKADSILEVGTLRDKSGSNTSVSGEGKLVANNITIAANSGNDVQISVAEVQAGTVTISAPNDAGSAGYAAVTISSAKFTATSFEHSSYGSLTISSANFTADSASFTGGGTGDSAVSITFATGANATIGAIESLNTHTITVENGATLTAGSIYRSGSTLNLAVNGTLNVTQLESYTGSTGMIYFGKSGDGATGMAQTLSGTGTANVYGIEANLGGGSLTISVANLNIGAGGITRYGSGNGTVTINGTKVGLYNTTASEISANITIGANGVTFNPESEGQTITLSGTVTGNGLVTKEGAGELAFTGTGSTLTNGLTVSAGTVSVATGASLTLGGTVTLASAISNSGTITIDSSTSFVINGIEMENNGSRDYYVVIDGNSGTGSISGSVTIGNFSLTDGDLSNWSVYTDNGYLVIYGEAQTVEGQSGNPLVWDGTEDNHTWNSEDSSNAIWQNESGDSGYYFTNGNDVTFGATDAYTTVAVESENAITAGSITVNSAYTFDIGDGASVTTGSLTYADGGSLTLTGSGSFVFNGEDVGTAFTISSDDSFTGNVEVAKGTLDLSKVSLGENTKLVIDAIGDPDGGNGAYTTSDSNAILFSEGNNTLANDLAITGSSGGVILRSAGTEITLSGSVTGDEGTTLQLNGNGTANFTGKVSLSSYINYQGATVFKNETTLGSLEIYQAESNKGDVTFTGSDAQATVTDLTVHATTGSGTATLTVSDGASLSVGTMAINHDFAITIDKAAMSITGTVTQTAGTTTSVTISNGGTLSLGDSVSLNVDVMNIVLGTANYDESNSGSGTFAIVGGSDSSLTLTDSAAITITVDSALESLLSSEGTYYFDISKGIVLTEDNLDWSALTSYGTVSYSDGIISVVVGTAIPEPGMFSLFFSVGALGLVATRRRRRKAA